MNSRTQRLLKIRELIENEEIASQEEILVRLKELGLDVTQSTLSRDLKRMQVAKIPHIVKGSIYAITKYTDDKKDDKILTFIVDALVSLEFSNNVAVLKTLSGYANAVTALIDNENYDEILGTIAGDDTIMIILRENVLRDDLINSLESIYPDIRTLYK